jgi:hypothetical protein
MDVVFESINEVYDLKVLRYSVTSEGHDYFYLLEQSSLLVLRIMPLDTPLEVKYIFSERDRIFRQIESIKKIKTVGEFLDLVIPLVESGYFDCKDLTLIVNAQIELTSHDEGEVHLTSGRIIQLRDILVKLLTVEDYDPNLLTEIMNRPNLYHKLERRGKILSSHRTFQELLDALR